MPIRPSSRSPRMAPALPVWIALALLALPAAGQGTAVAPLHAERLPEHLAGRAEQLSAFDLAELSLPATPDQPFGIELAYQGERFSLTLGRTSVRAPGYRVVVAGPDGRQVDADPGPVRTFGGSVAEDKGARVVGSMLPSGLQASVLLSDGRQLVVEPFHEAFVAGDRTQYLVYDRALLPVEAEDCGTLGSPVDVPPGAAEGLGACGGDFCVAELALECDESFYQYWQNSVGQTQSAAEYLTLLANVQYLRDVEIKHELTAVVIRAGGDPAGYGAATNRDELLDGMRQEWIANFSNIDRDLAHLLTDRFSGGVAYIGTVCGSWAYGVNSRPSSLACMANVLAHEMGHNWNADHCDCDGFPNPQYTMNPSFPPCPMRFNPANTIPDIRAFRNSRICLRAGVINDDRLGAIELTPGTVIGDTTWATPDGPATCVSAASVDVWFVYRPRIAGTMTATTCSPATLFDTNLGVHRPDGSLILCDASDFSCPTGSTQSTVTLTVQGGEAYYIRVGGDSTARGQFGLTLTGPPSEPPFNDARPDAMHVGPGVYYGTTGAAAFEGGIGGLCGLSEGTPDVWYRYQPGSSGVMTVDTCQPSANIGTNPQVDTVVSIHDENGVVLGCNDDFCSRGSRVEHAVLAGSVYFVRVSGYDGATGGFRMSLSGPAAINDVCDGALEIGQGTRLVSLQGAYLNDGSPTCGLGSDEPDLFYEYVNDEGCSGLLTVTTCGSNDLGGVDTGIDTVLVLYDGCPADNASMLVCNDDSASCSEDGVIRDSRAQVQLAPGQSVGIRVTRYNHTIDRKPFFLRTTFEPFAPSNDACSNAIQVTPGTYQGTTCGASADGVASCDFGSPADVWYRYTAPGDGTLVASTCGTADGIGGGESTVLSVHPDICPAGAQLDCSSSGIGCGPGGSSLDARLTRFLTAGQSVRIRVSTFSQIRTTPFLLHIEFQPGSNYCSLSPNSATAGARIGTSGSASLSAADLVLRAEDVPAGRPGLFFLGPNQVNAPFGEGRRCVGGATRRISPISASNASGIATRPLDFGAPYASSIFIGGGGVNYQYWFRDPGVDSDGDGTVEGFNLSDAINVVHTP